MMGNKKNEEVFRTNLRLPTWLAKKAKKAAKNALPTRSLNAEIQAALIDRYKDEK